MPVNRHFTGVYEPDPGYSYFYMGKQHGHGKQPCRRLRSVGWGEYKVEVEFEDGARAIVPRQLVKRRLITHP